MENRELGATEKSLISGNMNTPREVFENIEKNSNLNLLFSELEKEYAALHKKYKKFINKRVANENKNNYELFTFEEIILNSLSSDESKINKISQILLDHGINNPNIEKKIFSFHVAHKDMNLQPFELSKHPDLMKSELKSLYKLGDIKGCKRGDLFQVYRKCVDSGVCGSIERLEKIKEKIKKIDNIKERIGDVPMYAVTIALISILYNHGVNPTDLAELSTGKYFITHITEPFYQILLFAGILAPKISYNILSKVIKHLEKNQDELSTANEKIHYIKSYLDESKTNTLGPFYGSFEFIDEVFTDKEIESYYEEFKEKKNNRGTLEALEELLNDENIEIYSNKDLKDAMEVTSKTVDNIEIDFKNEALERMSKLSGDRLYNVLRDLIDNLDHMHELKPQIDIMLKEIEHLKGDENTITKIKKYLLML